MWPGFQTFFIPLEIYTFLDNKKYTDYVIPEAEVEKYQI